MDGDAVREREERASVGRSINACIWRGRSTPPPLSLPRSPSRLMFRAMRAARSSSYCDMGSASSAMVWVALSAPGEKRVEENGSEQVRRPVGRSHFSLSLRQRVRALTLPASAGASTADRQTSPRSLSRHGPPVWPGAVSAEQTHAKRATHAACEEQTTLLTLTPPTPPQTGTPA